ncbi:3-isopropylmalate dehydrogenase [Oceanobacillus sp. 143]|jgi:3-isopropylmalate dehydrogenase|uniref:3-isopropylmalate dehydrogenase n=1 Tax=Oceanobacillus zhaokaii TaxID=2052660 RepID=A0A345PJF3_9BACI|nr:3-isopropylmalate dehydrogenase [Oceanobacillus zhaokaii]AXI10133.1 3-isopropylmalate dehydrogenase [Oceanobacillus zhaokaii]QGS69255.1 3-isopropylmalate dehydrogenase [Oceanobacillus sp. 143]
MKKNIVLLPGDGIGPEIMESAKVVLNTVASEYNHEFNFHEHAIGGDAIDRFNNPLPEETIHACKAADAVLLGAVGGKKWDNNPSHLRPEKGLLGIRKALGLFANLRPIKGFNSLLHASPLKEEKIAGSDILIIRELTGGLYFGTPSERRENGNVVVDTLYYERHEMERIIDKAFQSAMQRKKQLTSVDKANVLESSRMWREIVDEKANVYPEVEVEHLLVDAAAMKLITQPNHFDVIVTENLFGDILSDEASVLTGSLGMLPSASIRTDGVGLYEPVHGSAPDIAGKGIANPLGMILSTAMMLRHSLGLEEEAAEIERAVNETLEQGYHTADLQLKNGKLAGTKEITDAVIENLTTKSISNSICNMYV